jgi:hypothetical protein
MLQHLADKSCRRVRLGLNLGPAETYSPPLQQMSQSLGTIHFALAGLWLCSIIAEMVIAQNLLSALDGLRLRLCAVNWRIAFFVEVPSILGLFASGAYLLSRPHASSVGFHLMLTVGVSAIFLGIFKVWLTHASLSAARRSSWVAYEKLSYFQRLLGVMVLSGVLVAIIGGAISKIAA